MPTSPNTVEPVMMVGKFWLPGSEDAKVSGHLVLAEDRIRLELIGALTPAFQLKPVEGADGIIAGDAFGEEEDRRTRLTIHGTLMHDPGDVTLVGCYTLNHRFGAFSDIFEEQHFGALYMVGGAHVDGDKELFTGLRIRCRNLETWAGVGTVGLPRPTEEGGLTLTYHKTDLPAADLADGSKIGLRPEAHAPLSESFDGRHLEHRVWFEVLDTPGSTWAELDRRLVTPLVSLLTLCVGENCPVVEKQARTQAGDWVEVIHRARTSGRAGLGPHSMTVRLAEMTLAGVAKWLNLVEKLGPLPPVVANSFASSNIHIETELLELTTVAEGLHARLFEEDKRIEDEVAERIKSAVKASVKGEDPIHRQIISGYLKHLQEPSYKARLRRLVSEASAGMPGVVADLQKWAKHVDECRNTYAHRTAGFIKKESIDEYIGIIFSVRWVLRGILLLRAGISPEVLAVRLEQDASYLTFRDQMRRYMPDVYGQSAEPRP